MRYTYKIIRLHLVLQAKHASQEREKCLGVPGSSEERKKGEMLALNSQLLSTGLTMAGRRKFWPEFPCLPKSSSKWGSSSATSVCPSSNDLAIGLVCAPFSLWIMEKTTAPYLRILMRIIKWVVVFKCFEHCLIVNAFILYYYVATGHIFVG